MKVRAYHWSNNFFLRATAVRSWAFQGKTWNILNKNEKQRSFCVCAPVLAQNENLLQGEDDMPTPRMPVQRVNVPKLSDAIMHQLESMILEGSLKPGDRLPPERQLAEQLGVSRPLREAIQRLAARACWSAARAAAPASRSTGGGVF